MTKRLRQVLEVRKYDRTGEAFGPHSYVFGNEVGERLHSMRAMWESARRKSGIQGLHFHDLRREFASRLMESGAAEHDVRDWLGHANIATTSRYLSSSAFRRQEVRKRFEAARELELILGRLPLSAPEPGKVAAGHPVDGPSVGG